MPDTTAPAPIGVIAPLMPTLSEWVTAHDSDPGATRSEDIIAAASYAASQLADGPVAAITMSPGNGYVYDIAVTRLDGLARASWGGDHLISLPEFHRCTLLSFGGGYHVPGYVEEKMRLGGRHDAVVAAFCTVLDHLLIATAHTQHQPT